MIEVSSIALSLLAGTGAGALFFEGLWRTVLKATGSTKAIPVLMVSFFARAILLLLVLWAVSRGDAFRLAACMTGFLIGRMIILRFRRGGRSVAN